MSGQSGLLVEADGDPVSHVNAQGKSVVLLVCEHASLKLPRMLGTLGLSPEALTAHIAWDPGALAVAARMSALLDAHLIHQNFSRLVYDCNRPPSAPDAMPARSEIYDIPGNRDLSEDERRQRAEAVYTPFKAALADAIAGRKAAGRDTVLVTVHSFTPVYNGVARAVEIGILHDQDRRLADIMLRAAEGNGRYVVRRNEPYGPQDGVTHTLREHGLANGLDNVMIEVRNDLIGTEAGQDAAAQFLVGLLNNRAAKSSERRTG